MEVSTASAVAIIEPVFDGIVISVTFKDDELDVSFSGDSNQTEDWYKSNLHTYLRKKYSDSPVAYFKIVDTDNQTYVNYEVITNVAVSTTNEVKTDKITLSDSVKEDVNTELAILKEKKKLAEVELDILKEKSNLANKALELIKAGFSKEEAMKILGL